MTALIGITAHDEKAYCFERVLRGALVMSGVPDIRIAVTVAPEDERCTEIFYSVAADQWRCSLLQVERRPVVVPQDHVFTAGWAEVVYIENIVAARAKLRRLALDGWCRYLMFIDADVCLEPDALSLMVSSCQPVATVPLPLRQFNERGFCGVQSSPIHLGATLIRRDVLERVPFRYEIDGGRPQRGEDKCFFEDLGYFAKVWVMPNIDAIHYIDPAMYPCGYSNQDLRPREAEF